MSAAQLLGLNDRQFVEECYRKLLLREPDIDGVVNYLTRISLGDDRLAIAAAIASSEEGRRKARNRQSLALDILQLHAERLILNAWTPKRCKSAATKIRHYMSVLAGHPDPQVKSKSASTSDPFSDYLTNVIEDRNS